MRSVNLTLTVIKPTAAPVILRRGCVFASGSANLTWSCERYLRVVSQRIPRNAKGVRITIVGVSVDEPTRAEHGALARKRARTVALYLRAIGVRGNFVKTTVIHTGRPLGPVAAQGVVVRKGKPRTTVTFRFSR